MKHLKFGVVALLLLFSVKLMAQENRLTVYPDEAKTKINKEIYGQFAEHLGHGIYGGIYVGEKSDIPNIDGYRTDVVNALKAMKVSVIRWPGGCFADTYHWKDGIGPKDKRPSIVNVNWGGVTEDNSFGTNEFLDFCELVGAEPYISVNVGSGTVQEASQWVEYVNSNNDSPMTRLRKKNGRQDPWNVKYWGVGNESWGCGGNMTPDYYADLFNRFSTFMWSAPYKIASGPNVDDYNWTETVMKKAMRHPNLIQGLSLHYYTIPHNWHHKGAATGFNEDEWFTTLKKTLYMDELIRRHTAIMDHYDPQHRVGLIVDEWGDWFDVEPGTNPGFLYQQNTMRDALVAGVNLNIFNKHADRVKMANIAQMINVLQSVILTKGKQMVLTPTYYVYKMYSVHQDARLVPMNLKSASYTYKGDSIPAISSSASVKNGVLSITLCNLDPEKAESLECDIPGVNYKEASGKIVDGQSMESYNDFGKKPEVTMKDFAVAKPKNGKLNITLPAHSVVLVQLK
ncbi:alpha-N-arabinofuranosidase [Prolixibacter denitrificans]|uniref:non-reducing end alpha-L-arabinofuranosidase n=1 Tax=Prolixibacter denitrificans TaxID=1541063 RepID=A0A2P8C6B0_9BACT|nr:alpha-L-arabinofuranosidase C-terminal domain-containing protein [Prolixibacter denitrificans]PSK80491.1 alpha-N-arabinofuranosidase [Prolixibacter denitrificans]GET22731.1 alpha-N-arabinofuranosidase [Prolixibacter denitrificans]